MINSKSFTLLILFLALSVWNGKAQSKILYPKNEFRAVWIATVVNIDWPKVSTDSVQKQKNDFIEILDTYKKLNYNAVIVQIRSNGDAFYASKLAPWSRYLTGKEGEAPNPYYDPLEWMITEAHSRGLEFHAWLNPFRAIFDLKFEICPQHDAVLHPDWMIKYAGKLYYNPALPEVQNHLTKVVEEVVQNYDIDAIHFDDYFYPYTVNGEKFNDFDSYIKYGNGLSLGDWRRSNVSNFVSQISKSIKNSKPWVQFGISPFGVWRNKSMDSRGSDTQSGQTNYDDLFADPLAWMENNWIDYILPQLYWSLDHPKASYSKLLKWWSENSKNTAIYIGNSSYKIKSDGDKKWNFATEIPNQIDYTRTFSNVQGNAFFSAKWFIKKNREVTQLLSKNQYKYPAIPLAVPNLRRDFFTAPKITDIAKMKDSIQITFQAVTDKIRYVVLYGAENQTLVDSNDPSQIIDKINVKRDGNQVLIIVSNDKIITKSNLALTYIDYYGNESKPLVTEFPLINKAN